MASEDELATWARASAPDLAAGITLTIDGEPVRTRGPRCPGAGLPGQGDLSTLRFEGDFVSTSPPSQGMLAVTDTNEPDRIGWREITAVGEDGAALSDSTVPTDSVSDALRSYPQDLLASPLDVTTMTTSFAPGQSAPSSDDGGAVVAEAAVRPGVEGGPFASLLSNQGFALVALGIVLAMAFGAWHALLPGHGKTLMAAYMVGSKARARQAISVGSAVAVMHTASVLALGLLVLTLEQTFRPESCLPVARAGLGARGAGPGRLPVDLAPGAWGADRRHGHVHDHDASLEHDHGLGRHSHALPEGMPLVAPRSDGVGAGRWHLAVRPAHCW